MTTTWRIEKIVADIEGRLSGLTKAQRADVNVQRTIAALAKIKAAPVAWQEAHNMDDTGALLRAAEAL